MNTGQGTTASHQPKGSILSASGLDIPAHGQSPAMSLNLDVPARALVLVLSSDPQRSSDIVDRLLGLQQSPHATVHFLGRRWIDQGHEQAFLLRREIGRVQYRGNWVEDRSVMDNILLPGMHNTVTPEHELQRNASALAQQFGLPGLPTLPPARVPPTDLRRAACIRAFLGRPSLVVLEHPLGAESSDLLPPMMNAIQQVRRRHGAVLWFTEHLGLAVDHSIPASRRLQIVGTKLVELRS